MANITINIGGLGPVSVSDNFKNLTPEQQNATVDEIVAAHGSTPSASSGAPAALPSAAPAPAAAPAAPQTVDPHLAFNALVNHESSNRAGVLGPLTKWGRAEGVAQTLPATAEAMAKKIGVPWSPNLLTDTSEQGRRYQSLLGAAYFNQGLELNHGDIRKALMYYYGGPGGQGPKAEQYADSIISAIKSGKTQLDHAGIAPGGNNDPTTSSGTPSLLSPDAENIPASTYTDSNIPQFTDAQKQAIMSALPQMNSGADLDKFVSNLTGGSPVHIGNSQDIVDYLKGQGVYGHAGPGDISKVHWAAPQVQGKPQPQNNANNDPSLLSALETGASNAGSTVLNTVLHPVQSAENAGLAAWNAISHPEDTLNSVLAPAQGLVVHGLLDPISNLVNGKAASADPRLAGIQSAYQNTDVPLFTDPYGQLKKSIANHPFETAAALTPVGKFLIGKAADVAPMIPFTPQSNFVKSVVSHDLGPEAGEVAQDYLAQADQTHPKGIAPRGRQPINVEDINTVGDRGLKGMRSVIAKAPIPQTQKLLLNRALDQQVDIPLQRTPDLGPDRMALSDLQDPNNPIGPNNVYGNGVVAAIRRAKAGDILSARYGGDQSSATRNALGMIAGAVPLPYGKPSLVSWIKGAGKDINKSRMDAAATAIKRVPLFQRALDITGPSNYGPAMQAFNAQTMSDANAVDLARAAKAAQATAKAKAAAARASQAQQIGTSNDLMSRRMEASTVVPNGGFRGMIYQNTGLTQPAQDAGLLRMVMNKEIQPEDVTRIMQDPNSLKRGGSTAGLKLMDRLGQMADQGILQRDPNWTAPEPQQAQQNAANWVDAQGDPIRSAPAYMGGTVKNILQQLFPNGIPGQEGGDLGGAMNAETPQPAPKPKAAGKAKKSKKATQ
jgi:hypothetical protein